VKKVLGLMIAFMVLASSVFAISVDEIIGKMKDNQNKIKDMYAETVTIMDMSGFPKPKKGKAPEMKMEQKGKLWVKGEDKSRVELDSPVKQIMVTNGEKLIMINPKTGEKLSQDLKQAKKQNPINFQGGNFGLSKLKEQYNMSVREKGNELAIICEPKNKKEVGVSIEIYIDKDKWLAKEISVKTNEGLMVSNTDIEYQNVSGAWVPKKMNSMANAIFGKMKIKMLFNNIKVNQGIDDKVFKIDD